MDSITRRRFLKIGTIAGAGLLAPPWLNLGCGGNGTQTAPLTQTSTALKPRKDLKPAAQIDRFIDPLPVPPALEADREKYPGSDYYEVRMSQFTQELHSQLPATPVWGYGGSFPGPTIEARRDRPVRVKWINDDLPETHLLEASIDRTIFRGREYPDVRTVVHLHGSHVAPQYDGQPGSWSTPGGAQTGELFYDGEYIYTNDQPACALWYHDHAMAITRLNVYAGLAGLYFIRDETEDSLNLPSGEYEIPLVLQDRSLGDDGSLVYPTKSATVAHPIWAMRFAGSIPLVNGRAFPYLAAEPRRYRLRILNGSQSRFYNLWFDAGGARHPFHVIGSDGGLLPAPVPLDTLRLAPAERADVLLDLSDLGQGTVLTLRNDAPIPYPTGGDFVIPEIMQVRVERELAGSDDSTPPGQLSLPALPEITPTPGLPSRVFNLDIISDGAGGVSELLINNRYFNDPVEERPASGTTEVWEFVNLTGEAHPIHLHLVQFRVLNSQPLDAPAYWGDKEAFLAGAGARPDLNQYLKGQPVAPPAQEAGRKDTAIVLPEEVLRLAVPFDLPPGAAAPARYICHCHILEHEDNEMMRPFDVV